jgi:hypothetical protein
MMRWTVIAELCTLAAIAQAQALFVELPYGFQLRAQDFPFPPEMIRLA